MKRIESLNVGRKGSKYVERFENNVNITIEKGTINAIKYHKGKVAIGINVSDKTNAGYQYNQNLKNELPKNVIRMIEFFGGRVTKGQILYGSEWVPESAVLSKLQDMRLLASYISDMLGQSK
jgi:acetate kinase